MVEKLKKQRYKIFCPKCGHRLFRGSFFDLEMVCPNCGSNLNMEREDLNVRIVLEMQVSEG